MNNLAVQTEKLKNFCEKWNVSEIDLFGSVLRSDFKPDSDIDVLISWKPGAKAGLLSIMEMKDELTEIFGHKVDIVSRKSIEHSHNSIRKNHILNNMELLYALQG